MAGWLAGVETGWNTPVAVLGDNYPVAKLLGSPP